MSLELPSIVDIIEVMENYITKIRPPEHIREQLDLTYKIENQNVLLLEIRPMFQQPGIKRESAYAKAAYVKSTSRWKVYWMRSNLKWTLYEPSPEVLGLKDFLKLVDEDAYHCFKG